MMYTAPKYEVNTPFHRVNIDCDMATTLKVALKNYIENVDKVLETNYSNEAAPHNSTVGRCQSFIKLLEDIQLGRYNPHVSLTCYRHDNKCLPEGE